MSGYKVTKPKGKVIDSSKSSDRRLAAGRQPANFLHSSINVVKPTINLKSKVDGGNESNSKTVKRNVGDKTWEDSSLLEWNPKHFRLFVGNLGPDANDALLATAFGKYETLSKVKVPIDNRTGKNKGFGFAAFESADDYFKAFKEMNGKYIGQHPVQLKRAETKIKPVKKRR
ncbi:hypothetical protein CAAN1_13S03884 [[Candida] anglica]|uniref:RRM domain-containing protein n=1 Tax=[Candida] anglica TaxID=148631 RepID=A0ABP0EGC8_9ASCO